MRMNMRMRFARWVIRAVLMLMMHVVRMRVRVNELFVHVLVFVALGEVQPHAYGHKRSRSQQLRGDRSTEGNDCRNRANERGR